MQSKFLLGVLLLILSILFPLFKFEQHGVSIISQIKESKIYKEKAKADNRTSEMLKNEISTIQKTMETSKNQLNELIQQSFELNEEINTIFRDTLLDVESADSVNNLYTKKLLINENSIDSVNTMFNQQSDALISKINEFAYSSSNTQLQIIKSLEQKQLIILNIIFIIVYLTLMIFGVKKSKILMKNQ